MKNYFLKIIALIFVVGIFFTACTEDFKPDSSTAKDNIMTQNILLEIFELVNNNTVTYNSEKSFLYDTTCFSKTIDTLEDGMFRLTITFDKENCDFEDNFERKGQIITVFEENWFEDKNKILTTTFNNFSINDAAITGEIQIEFMLFESLTQKHKITANNLKINFPDKTEIICSGNLLRHIKEENKIEINSEYSGKGRNGSAYTTLGEKIIKDYSCDQKQATSGRFTITKTDSGDVIILDFGEGECDGEYIITENGTTVSVSQ